MKILMLAPQPFLEPRGTPISVYQRLLGLSALGHEVDLVTYHVGQNVDIPGVSIHRTPRIPFIKHVRIGPSIAKIFLDVLVLFKAVAMLLSNRYSAIHSHEEAAFFAAVLSKVFRVPHLYDMHSLLSKQLENFGFKSTHPAVRLFERLETWVINTCDAVVTIGEDLEEFVLKTDANVTHVRIENTAVNHSSTPSPEAVERLREQLHLGDRLPVVYTGTFENYQGLDLLFDSAVLVKDKHPEVVFVMVGGKNEQIAFWEQEVERLGLAEHVVFVGTVSLEEAVEYLEMAKILVSPRKAGLSVPLKIYSYMHSGKPVVVTDITAHSLVLNDETAVLVEPTKEAFAGGVVQLIEDAQMRQALGTRAKAVAKEKYGFDAYVKKLEGVYKSLQPKASRLSSLTRMWER